MPIEFHCPGCGKLMRTPDETAGRKGKCPHCGTKVQIPDASLAAPAPPLEVPPLPAVTSPAPESPAGTIQFFCASCGGRLQVPAANAGKQGRCPKCGAVTLIPPARAGAAPAAEKPKTKWKGSPSPAPGGSPIQFACPACRKTVRVPASAGGSRGKCPHCAAIVTIPGGSSTGAGSGGLTPIPSGGGLTPLGTGGLTPLPRRGGDDLFADLPDLSAGSSDPFAGLSPLPGGGAAGGGWGTSPFGGGAAVNPYASPVVASSRPRSAGHTNKPKRSGLPWDNRERADSPFWGTVKLVLGSPTKAFYLMRRTGGLGGPLSFCVFGVLTGAAATVGYVLAMQLVGLILAVARGGGAGQGPPPASAMVVGFLIVAAIYVVGGLVMSAVGAVVTAFLHGGLIHLFLKLVGGADHPFETTFRVVCYALGATSVYQLIPGCGGLIGAVSNLVTLIIGMYAAHETTGGKAAAGVLLPILSICALCGILAFAMFTAISGMIQNLGPQAGG